MIAIYFNDKTCPVCSGSIQDFDYFGNIVFNNSKETRFSKCNKCKTEYLKVVNEESSIYKSKQYVLEYFKSEYIKE